MSDNSAIIEENDNSAAIDENDTREEEPEESEDLENNASSLVGRFRPDEHIHLHYVRVYYEGYRGRGQRTIVSEQEQLVQWRSDHFRCEVGLSLEPSVPAENWTIGLAQACDYITLKNVFGNGGYYAWEFHPLKSGRHRMVNDSNGTQWPFYSDQTAMFDIGRGRVVDSNFKKLYYTDYFYPTMLWYLNDRRGNANYLTRITRRQGFKIWLLAIKRGSRHTMDGSRSAAFLQLRPGVDEIFVIKEMQWRYNVNLRFDSLRPRPYRCIGIEDQQEEQPMVFDTVDPIPTSALVPPNCNSCQSLIFYPSNAADPLALRKPPEHSIVSWSRWRKEMTDGFYYVTGFEEPSQPLRQFPYYEGDPMLNTNHLVIPYTLYNGIRFRGYEGDMTYRRHSIRRYY